MKKNELIPAAATVTLPASEYYGLIKLVERLIGEQDSLVNSVQVSIAYGQVNVTYAKKGPFEQAAAEQLAKLLAEDELLMDNIVSENRHYYSFGDTCVNSYNWGSNIDLLDIPAFKVAWVAAQERRPHDEEQS